MNERLKQLRKALDLTQRVFAERIGTKQNTIATYEMGRNNPSDPIIHSICREFNVNEDWLRNGSGEMFIEKTTFSLDDYADCNNLTNTEREIVRGFMELDPVVRNAIYDIFKNAFKSDNSAYDNAPDNPQELEKQFPPIDSNDIGTNIG